MADLTPRQLDVLRLAAEGKGLKETAALLHIECATVKYHRRLICLRLDAANITGAVAVGVRRQLVP